jgi:hypothetical protein
VSDRGLYGASFRNECVATLQQILADAGLSQMLNPNGSSFLRVEQFINALQQSGYSQTNNPTPGDFVDYSDGHVGVCSNVGCSESISNGSTSGKFDFGSIGGYGDGLSTNQINAYEDNGSITYYHHQ